MPGLPFRAPVVVVALDRCCGFLEANVVKSSKGSATDVFDCVVRDKELLLMMQNRPEITNGMASRSYEKTTTHLPPHKNIVGICKILIVKII